MTTATTTAIATVLVVCYWSVLLLSSILFSSRIAGYWTKVGPESLTPKPVFRGRGGIDSVGFRGVIADSQTCLSGQGRD